MAKYKYSKIWYAVLFLLLANIAAAATTRQFTRRDYGKLHFFDVGQGDAIYYRTGAGNDVLIDSGPGDAVLGKLGKVMPFWDRELELVILTHPHADHISGMVELLKRYKVKTVMLPHAEHNSEVYKTLLSGLEAEKTSIVRPRLGQRIFLDEVSVFDIYYPVLIKFEDQPKDINDVSVVGRLSFGKINVLLTGDAGRDIENLLLRLGLPLQAEILKVAHHGSRHSSTLEFLNAASSTYAVISVGKNSYGHPHEEVLGFLEKSQAKLFRTDEEGDVVFELYPDRVKLHN